MDGFIRKIKKTVEEVEKVANEWQRKIIVLEEENKNLKKELNAKNVKIDQMVAEREVMNNKIMDLVQPWMPLKVKSVVSSTLADNEIKDGSQSISNCEPGSSQQSSIDRQSPKTRHADIINPRIRGHKQITNDKYEIESDLEDGIGGLGHTLQPRSSGQRLFATSTQDQDRNVRKMSEPVEDLRERSNIKVKEEVPKKKKVKTYGQNSQQAAERVPPKLKREGSADKLDWLQFDAEE